jgi:hypothetical protein
MAMYSIVYDKRAAKDVPKLKAAPYLLQGEKMLAFMNLPREETEKVIQAAIWYSNNDARLS